MQRNAILGLSKSGFHSVSYLDWGEPDAAHVVVCVHGLTRNARDFDVLAGSLQSECRVVCPDVVGRGLSGWLADPADYAMPQYLADMTALLARITAHSPPDVRIDWVGTSMGGLIGMLLAAQPETPIRRLVVNDVGPHLPKAALERIGTYVGKAPRFQSLDAAQRYVRTVSAAFGPLTDAQWRHLTEHSVQADPQGGWVMRYDPGIAFTFTQAQADVSLWPVWDCIRSPVLLLRGAQSDLLLRETALEMQRRGPDTTLVEFPGIGHAPVLMDEDQVSVVRDFLLDRHAAP